ncbi:MAG: carbohydrate-binding domain-containing protein, partial [Coriobacteriales bacterium]|nr:carbohydrate-binding domain-containing protein [Coriobacteriales bacterium]
MPTRKHIDAICIAATVLGIVLTILFINGSQLGITTIVDADAEANSDNTYFTANDLDGAWDTSDSTTITLAGTDATISGTGAYAYDGGVVIGRAGTYVISGELTDGSITVDADSSSKVWILFNGVTVNCTDDACLIVDQADKVFLTLAEGSANALTSGATMSEAASEDNTDGAIFAHDDLTINGSGSLSIKASYKHGISANDDLVITGGNITIEAPNDAIHANDSLRSCNVTLTASAQDDGLAVDNDDAYIYLESGTYTITASDEGIVAPGDVTIVDGNYTIAVGTEQGCHGIKAGGTCTLIGG